MAFMAHAIWKVAAGHQILFLYLVVFLTFMGFASHGTQDMYPTFLKTQRGFSPSATAVITVIANLGAILGGIVVGLYSDRSGRRRAIVLAFAVGILVIPLWAYAPSTALLAFGAFLLQFAVQGAWGIVPAHITELSPDHIRGFLPGFAYQCGMVLAGSVAYIEATFAAHTSYADAMAFTALFVFAAACVVAQLGREKHAIEFGKKTSM
jgi:SHS family lactate transporter-like MFS transporter